MISDKILFLWCFSVSLFYAQKTNVSIQTSDINTKIYLNDHFSGFEKIDTVLSVGKYIIRVEENSINWNRLFVLDTLIITGKDTFVRKVISFPVRKKIFSAPPGAEVITATEHLGYTPIEITKDVLLTLRLRGYNDYVLSTDSIQQTAFINLQPVYYEKRTEFIKSSLFKYLVGGIVLFGGTAAFFKLKADNAFDKYKSGGEKSYLEITRRYDLISGISFGFFQINFGIMIYYFLEENY